VECKVTGSTAQIELKRGRIYTYLNAVLPASIAQMTLMMRGHLFKGRRAI